AITYALYGDMSGSGRDVKTVRSQYSDPGDITEVELDFERGAYEYEVSFESGKYDYDYDIDAVSGKIKFSEKDLDD
ncbi:MAG: PepSY domain-containing protein, partial [Acutalibacteraceae bacterium]|nr:PepSY domain-containing protein [Acutalibacteraceae bacterium]